ncbi:hypothetical protein NA57DRAFT_31853, partial [Rhizodiscina lignyota]
NKYGKILIQTCSAFKNADQEIFERAIRIESCWKRTSVQLDSLSRVSSDLDEEHEALQNQILVILSSKLKAADLKLNSYLEEGPCPSPENSATSSKMVKIKRFKYALLKESLDKTILDLESWQKELFDPSWFLIARVAGQLVDKELSGTSQKSNVITTASGVRDSLSKSPRQNVSVFLPEDGLESAKIAHIPLSSAKSVQRAGSTKWLIQDSISCESSADFSQRRKAIRDLGRKLKAADPSTFALLNLVGVVAEIASNEFRLIFRTPDKMDDPQSLRTALIYKDSNHSLSDRFRIATQLARAICSFHTFGFVHKSIRPENILLFQDEDSILGSAFLLGFEKIRLEAGQTRLTGDDAWEKNLYRHPQRQGVKLQEPYVMQHDIYSLGVCLLEIGLWQSFVLYDDASSSPSEAVAYRFGAKATDRASYAESVKGNLLGLARESLPSRMGCKYAKIVETCLTCLDEGSDDFGDESEFQDEDGVLVAVRYIEKVGHLVRLADKQLTSQGPSTAWQHFSMRRPNAETTKLSWMIRV